MSPAHPAGGHAMRCLNSGSSLKFALSHLGEQTEVQLADGAVELFCYQVCRHMGVLTAVLGDLDTLVFTGGIGERAAPVHWGERLGAGIPGY